MSNGKKTSKTLTVPTYTVKTTKQKGIRMRVSPRGVLVVHANPFYTKEDIESFVLKHSQEFVYQPSVQLFGKSFKVRKVQGQTNHVSYSEDELLVQYQDKSDIEDLYKKFIKQISKDVLNDILDMTYLRFSKDSFEKPKLTIRAMTSSWGVCHPDKNSITLNSELVHYPVDFIEYVICHELIHFIEPNHSQSFYDILNEVMPDYRRRLDLIETSKEKQYLM